MAATAQQHCRPCGLYTHDATPDQADGDIAAELDANETWHACGSEDGSPAERTDGLVDLRDVIGAALSNSKGQTVSRRVLAADLKVGDITIENGRVEQIETLPDGRIALDFKWIGGWADIEEAGESGAFAPDDEFRVKDAPAVPTYHSDTLGRRVTIPEDDE